MKLLIIGDLHGRIPKIGFKDYDVIICVGDFACDKKIAKYTKEWFSYIKKLEEKTEGNNINIDKNKKKNKKQIRNNLIGNKKPVAWDEFIINKIGEENFENLSVESIEGGRKVLEYLNSLGKPVYIVPGNWDQSYGYTRIKDTGKGTYNYKKSFLDSYLNSEQTNTYLTQGLKNIIDTQYALYTTKGFNILGYGLSSAPENIDNVGKLGKKKIKILKDTYKKISNKLNFAYKKRNSKLPTILLSHNVPFGTKLDIITNENSYAYKQHLGSTIARDFINKHKPLLCIGGHIHDHFGKDKLGKTTVINAGFGADKNVLIELKGSKIKSIQFHGGDKKQK